MWASQQISEEVGGERANRISWRNLLRHLAKLPAAPKADLEPRAKAHPSAEVETHELPHFWEGIIALDPTSGQPSPHPSSSIPRPWAEQPEEREAAERKSLCRHTGSLSWCLGTLQASALPELPVLWGAEGEPASGRDSAQRPEGPQGGCPLWSPSSDDAWPSLPTPADGSQRLSPGSDHWLSPGPSREPTF